MPEDAPVGSGIVGCTPSFAITSYEAAVAHYVDWLGFTLEWEWRAAPGEPVIMVVSSGGLSLFLNEALEPAPLVLRVQVRGLEALAAEWSARGPAEVDVFFEPPYELPTAYVRDPFGNVLAMGEVETAADVERRTAEARRVRAWLEERRAAGAMRPAPADVASAAGCTLGMASEVLGEFPDWL